MKETLGEGWILRRHCNSMSPFAKPGSTWAPEDREQPQPALTWPTLTEETHNHLFWIPLRHRPQQWGAGSEQKRQIPGELKRSLPGPYHLDAQNPKMATMNLTVTLVRKSCDKPWALTHSCSEFTCGPSSANSPVGSSHAWIIPKMLRWVCTTHSASPDCILTPSYSTYRSREWELQNPQTTWVRVADLTLTGSATSLNFSSNGSEPH